MNSIPAGDNGVFKTNDIRFPDFDVSWVGEGPAPNLVSFGSDDGRLLLATIDAESLEVVQRPQVVAESGEAINGVAFLPAHGREHP